MALLVRLERWLPAVCGIAWWLVFYPGFFGEDSLINLGEARSGTISVLFTAWWVYLVHFISFGTRAIPLLTLVSVVGLQYAVYLWVTTVFPKGGPRAITVLLISASPLTGAMGIQVRHDVAMTSGLLLCAAVLTRTWLNGDRWRWRDLALLALAAPAVATRHNGLPTLLAAAALCLLVFRTRRWRQAAALAAVAAGAAIVTYGATRASGHSNSVDPMQTVEWLMADISCVLTKEAVEPTAAEWDVLTRIASRTDWPHERACRFMNPILVAPTFKPDAVAPNYRELIGVWLSIGARYPGRMLGAHAMRVRLFLPPFATGVPSNDLMPFLHSTILPNDFGLEWAFPRVANPARTMVRAWNALRLVLANAALWLLVLIAVAWQMPAYRPKLFPTLLIAAALELGLLVTAPISEGRYGLLILVCGQSTALFVLMEWILVRSDSSTGRLS